MVKIIYCLRRKPGMSVEDFRRYWFETHGPLVKERAAKLGIVRYIQSHPILDPRTRALADARENVVEPYDGVAELWFDDVSILYGAEDTPEAAVKAAIELLDDERAFIDLPNSPLFVVEEKHII